jgi:hypothetical protein
MRTSGWTNSARGASELHVSRDPLTAQHLNAIESFVAMLRLVDQMP